MILTFSRQAGGNRVRERHILPPDADIRRTGSGGMIFQRHGYCCRHNKPC
ncbi:MAG: hypothetical protein ABSB80_12305 [Methanoregula sp.]